MNRNSSLSIWHSRSRLGIVCISMIILLICIHLFDEDIGEKVDKNYRNRDISDKYNSDKEKRNLNFDLNPNFESSFSQDVDYAMESMQYMHDLRNNRAEIRDVIEKSREVKENWFCWLDKPDIVKNEGWIKNGGLYIYSATYDRRINSLYPENHAIQVLSMSYRSLPPSRQIFCNIRDLKSGKSAVVVGYIREIWQRAWDPRDLFYIPNLITCPLPNRLRECADLTVQLSDSSCKSDVISLRVRRKDVLHSRRRGVAVCVKGMDFMEDISKRFVEWIEAQYLMGADSITVYTYYISPETRKVLEYYTRNGKLTMVPLDLPGESPNQNYIRSQFIWRNRQQKRRHELIPYNDCLYRHIDTHDHILIVDTDEFVVPLKSQNWMEMLQEVVGTSLKHELVSVSILNAFKFPASRQDLSVPEYMYTLRNRRMSERISKIGEYGKSFTSTKTAASVFNHFALHRTHANVSRTIYAKKDIALKLHYKEKCPIESRTECSQLQKVTVDDPSLDRFADKLTKRVTEVLKELKMI